MRTTIDIDTELLEQAMALTGARTKREAVELALRHLVRTHTKKSGAGRGPSRSILYDLRRVGKTVRSAVDCCMAQIAIESDVLLLHRDRDFEIAAVRPPRQQMPTLALFEATVGF